MSHFARWGGAPSHSIAQLPSSTSFRPVEASGGRRASLPGLSGSSVGPDALSLSIKVCEDDVIRVTMEAQLSQDVLLGEEKAHITFVCMANSDELVEDVSIRLALAKGMTSSMGAPSSTSLSPHEDSITQVMFVISAFVLCVTGEGNTGILAHGPRKDHQERNCEVQGQTRVFCEGTKAF